MTLTIFDPWMHIIKSHPLARLRLVCFSYAGGGASIYRSWLNKLPAEIELCAVQLPGRENRIIDAPFVQLPPLIQTLAPALKPYLTKPCVFFGHSMGALVSFELARELRKQQGEGPLHLFVSSYRAPQLPDPDPPVHRLPDAEFTAELHKLNGTPHSVLANEELMQMMIPLLRADFTLCETYAYHQEEPLPIPITVFGGLQDLDIRIEQLEAWSEQTCSSFDLTMFQGDHFYIHTQRDALLNVLSQRLRHVLDRLD